MAHLAELHRQQEQQRQMQAEQQQIIQQEFRLRLTIIGPYETFLKAVFPMKILHIGIHMDVVCPNCHALHFNCEPLLTIHECIDFVIKPLQKAAEIGIMMSDPLGWHRYCFTPMVGAIMGTPEAYAGVSKNASPVTMAMYPQFGTNHEQQLP